MPRPLTAAGRAALQARTIAVAYLLEVATDEGALRINSYGTSITYLGDLYSPAPKEWTLPDGIPISKALVPETFTMEFDAGDENDTGTFLGTLLTRTWHQRPVRFFGLLLDTTNDSVIDEFFTWRGKLDTLPIQTNAGRPATAIMNCESGVFRAQERNFTTVSHNDQKRRDPTDTFFRDMAVKQDQQVPFGISWSKIPGYRPGGGNGGGGGGGGFDPGRGFSGIGGSF